MHCMHFDQVNSNHIHMEHSMNKPFTALLKKLYLICLCHVLCYTAFGILFFICNLGSSVILFR